MKKLLLAASIFALCSTGFASERAAMAESTASYSITRGETVLSARENALTEVRTGDGLVAGEKPVRVETTNGATILLGQNSRANFDGASHVVLGEGTLALASPNGSTLTASYGNLVFESIATPDNQFAQHMLVIQADSANQITAQSLSETYAVRLADTNEQIAVIGAGDDLVFKRVGDKWAVNAQTVGQPGGDESPVAGGSQAAQDEVSQDDNDRRKGGYYWVAGGVVGAAAAAGLGWAVYDIGFDDDSGSNDHDNRGPSSAIIYPTPTPSTVTR